MIAARAAKAGLVRLGAAAATLALLGCASPGERIERLAASYGFAREIIRGTTFDHVVYRNRGALGLDGSQPTLHLYFEGDGRPYLDRFTVAPDPTPRNPVMLRLMVLDDAPSVYIGRPCYFGLQTASGCSPERWTSGRFGEDVVASMAAVAEGLRAASDARTIAMIGHSGGAAIATLVARRIRGVDALITVAGNLDTRAWTALHFYEPLALSLNPVDGDRSSLPPNVIHFVGADDRVTPPAFVRAAATALGTDDVRVMPGMSHTCCWEHVWPQVLETIADYRNRR